MAKKRRTRQQKILADLRHNFNHAIVNQATPSAKISPQMRDPEWKLPSGQIKTTEAIKSIQKPQGQSLINTYPYLTKDLSKTGLLTTAILGFQFILFFLLKNRILIIPGISY